MGLAAPVRMNRLTPYRERLFREGSLRELRFEGCRFCVADRGRGRAVVLIHGLGGSLYDWRHLLEPLSESYRVIAPDLLGSGETDHPAGGDYSIRAQAKRLQRILEDLRVDEPVLVGNSYGGGIALQSAQDLPGRVERLVLLNSVCYADRVPAYVELARLPLAGFVAERVPLGNLTRWALGKRYPTVANLTDEEFDAYQRELRRPGRRRVLVEILRAIIPSDPESFERRLRTIAAPSLLIWGAADPTIPVELGRRLAKDLPDARLVELDAGHVPHQERPAEVLRLMTDFLR